MLWEGANLAFWLRMFSRNKTFLSRWQKLDTDEIQQPWWLWSQVTVAEAIQVLRIVVNLRFITAGWEEL